MHANHFQMTDRQKKAWIRVVDRINKYPDMDIPANIHHYGWAVRLERETYPGSGQAFSATYLDSDHAVQVSIGIYGESSIALYELDDIHVDGYEENCDCDFCREEYGE